VTDDMVSATNINHTNPTVAGNNATNAASETGDFDFLGYLLGLQATQVDEGTAGIEQGLVATKLNPSDIVDKAEESDDSKGKELSQWNQIFPGLSPLVASSPTTPVVMKSEEVETSPLPARLAANLWSTSPAAGKLSAEEQNGNAGQLQLSNAELPTPATKVVERYNSTQPETAPVQLAANSAKPGKADIELETTKPGDDRKRIGQDTVDFDGVSASRPMVSSPVSQMVEAKPEAKGTTVNELFQKVETMFHQGGGKMTVHLSPPELGQVQIQVSSRGKRVEIEMKSDNDFAKSVLESKLGDLRQTLQSQDLVLSKMEVHVSRESSAFGESNLGNFSQGSGTFQNSSHGFTENKQQERGFNQSRSSQPARFSPAPIAPTRVGNSMGNGRVDVRI